MSAGEDAQGQVLVRCRRSIDEGPGALVVSGHGLSTNIIEASLEAYLVAVNKLHGAEIDGVAGASSRRALPRSCRDGIPGDRHATASSPIPGDGVGPEVIAAGAARPRAVGGAFGFSIDWPDVIAGGAAIDAFGTAIRDEDVDALRRADAVLLGAVGGPQWDDPTATVRPGAGPVRAPRRPRPVRQPAAGHGRTRRSCRRRRFGPSSSRASTC